MKMSNADIVLNAAERVVKCKFAYICPGYYITAPAFSSRAGGWGGWGFYCVILQNVAFLPGCRAQMVRSRTVPSFDVDKQLFVGFFFFSSVHGPHRACWRASEPLHSNTCFITAEIFPSESVPPVRVLARMGP